MAHQREGKSTRKPRRASKRIVGLSVELVSELRKTVFLPPELKLAIVGCMGKYELKKMRLISREWSMFATPLLFDKVYISPRKIDLTVFNNITQHPVLGPVVREVIYDTSRFEDGISRRDYFDRLCEDLVDCYVQKNGDLEWPSHHLISALKAEEAEDSRDMSSENSTDELYERHRKDDFVRKGYRIWRHHAKSERQMAEGIFLSRTLTRGIQKSNAVRSFFVIGNLWETNLDETARRDKYLSGPPSIRCWNSLHARPRYDFDHEPSDVSFVNAIIALWLVEPVVSLSFFKGMVNCGKGLAPFALKQWSRCSVFTAFLDVCIHLESFSLTIETEDTDDYAAPKLLGILPRILYRMKHLKRLDLELPIEDSSDSNTYINYEQVFPQEGRWLQLVDLDIAGLAIGGYQLVWMLSKRFPKLQRLSLINIELVDGSWEGAIEGMRHAMQLQSLSLGYGPEDLKQRSGVSFKTAKLDCPKAKNNLLNELEDYVVFGGRHPCLSTDVPAEEALNFWLDICPLEKRRKRAYF